MIERRRERRGISTFRSAYVRAGGAFYFVTLRNISDSGICLEGDVDVAVGDTIEYCFDSNGERSGVVKWVEDGRFGVSAASDEVPPDGLGAAYPPRSVRLPITYTASLFVDGCSRTVELHNLSLRGACVAGMESLAPGQLVSLEIAGRSFELATVRWARAGLAGIRFAEPVETGLFRDLVRRLQAESRNARERGGQGMGEAHRAGDEREPGRKLATG